jgi:hypothetical protein
MLLFSKKANPNILNQYNETPLSYAGPSLAKELNLSEGIISSSRKDVVFDNCPLFSDRKTTQGNMSTAETSRASYRDTDRKFIKSYREYTADRNRHRE